jgi:ribosome-associated protein
MKRIPLRSEYITLGQMLKVGDCIDSGGQAKAFLTDVSIKVNGEQEDRRGRKLYFGDIVDVDGYGTFMIG